MNIYSTFYHAPRPEGIEKRKAHIIGGGIAGLSAAAFLIDDAGMPGENITIYEKRGDVGGCCGVSETARGYICPGERELEANMECLWYLCSKIPSLETPGRTVLDESADANKDHPIHSECRILQQQGHIFEGIHNFRMRPETTARVQQFLAEPEEALENLTIEDYFGRGSDFFDSSLWWCFHTMLAFKPWHSALEAKRYLTRFGLAIRIDYLEGILHTRRNEYDSIIHPLTVWLKERGVTIETGCSVRDVDLDPSCCTAEGIRMQKEGIERYVSVRPEDFVFVTNGSLMTNASFGDNTHPAKTNRDTEDLGLFSIWKNLAAKNEKFGHPEKFIGPIEKTRWMSFFMTVQDVPQFFQRLEKMTGSVPGTGGCITVKDSGWEISFMLYDRDYFPGQRERNQDVLWGDGLFGERNGSYIRKPMAECTGDEILQEFLYHLNMLDMYDDLKKHTFVSTCMMPYITSQFMPGSAGDRPGVVPEGCTNLAFIGQYVEVPGDVVFTVETSVRTALEAVYKLTNLDREIIEVYPSQYDIRYFLQRMKKFACIEGDFTEEDLPKINPLKAGEAKKKLLKRINAVPDYYIRYPGRDKSVAAKKSVLHPQYPKV